MDGRFFESPLALSVKLLLAIKSCWRHLEEGHHNVIRETWGKDVEGADVLFFVGRPLNKAILKEDERQVDAPDGYHELGYKVKETCKYALNNNYDFLFSCDTDTGVVWHHLIKSEFECSDYMGYWPHNRTQDWLEVDIDDSRDKSTQHLTVYPWASGGVGYFLSRKAMRVVVDEPVTVWPEDLWVGQAMVKNDVFFRHPYNYEGFCAIHARDLGPVKNLLWEDKEIALRRWYNAISKICDRTGGCDSPWWSEAVDRSNIHFCDFCKTMVRSIESVHSCGAKSRARGVL